MAFSLPHPDDPPDERQQIARLARALRPHLRLAGLELDQVLDRIEIAGEDLDAAVCRAVELLEQQSKVEAVRLAEMHGQLLTALIACDEALARLREAER